MLTPLISMALSCHPFLLFIAPARSSNTGTSMDSGPQKKAA